MCLSGHFTQLVWKSSREVGIGRAQSRDGRWFVVANFFPAGNFIGRNAENVLPPRDGKVAFPVANNDSRSFPSQGNVRLCVVRLCVSCVTVALRSVEATVDGRIERRATLAAVPNDPHDHALEQHWPQTCSVA